MIYNCSKQEDIVCMTINNYIEWKFIDMYL